MRLMTNGRVAVAALAALGATTVATNSYAVLCNDASIVNPIYVSGSSAVKPLVAALGASLYASGVTIVYISAPNGSCDGVNAIVSGNLISGSGTYWAGVTDAGAPMPTSCDAPDPDGGVGLAIDLGVSDVWPETCGATPDYTKVGDFHGPNQVMTFVNPVNAKSYINISAEAAYLTFGKAGGAKTVAPWTDVAKLSIRKVGSGTMYMLGKAIHLDASLWKGTPGSGSADVVSAVTNANNTDPTPEATLGILSTGESDVNRAVMKVLGFQDFGSKCAYWPDSSLTTFDKINVRTGLYPIWGPLHLLAKVPAKDMLPTNTKVADIVQYLTGDKPPPASEKQVLDVEIGAHVVPQCAMKKTRTSEIGPMTDYKPAKPCGCYFEFKAAGGTADPTGCTKCTGDGDCGDAGTKTCNYGYCEAK